jgi:cobalt-zinc-cadmium efflux system protein
MSHQHHSSSISQKISIAVILNVVFTIIEFFGGLYTSSLAILSDSLHDFGDSLVLILAWFANKKSQKEPDFKKTFGYQRLSLFSAIITSTVLVVGSIFILINAIPRLLHPQPVNSSVMIIISIIGVICNGLGTLNLNDKNNHNRNRISLTWHLLEDVLGWVVVLIGSIIIQFFNLPIIDPIMTLAYTAFILFNVVKNLRENLNILMEGIPENLNFHQIKQSLLKIPGIIDVHDIHIWSLDGDLNIFTGHLVINNFSPVNIKSIKKSVKSTLKTFNISHSTLEIEDKDTCSGIDCSQLQY